MTISDARKRTEPWELTPEERNEICHKCNLFAQCQHDGYCRITEHASQSKLVAWLEKQGMLKHEQSYDGWTCVNCPACKLIEDTGANDWLEKVK